MNNKLKKRSYRPRKSRQERRASGAQRIRGHSLMSVDMSTTSNIGATVFDRREIDTDLCEAFFDLARVFQRWRVRKLKFTFKPIYGSQTQGIVGMCILDDPDSATPTTYAELMNCRTANSAQQYQGCSLTYKPKKESWLYTKDAGLSDDRFEMPGDLILVTFNWASSVFPGYINIVYDVEFDCIVHPNVSARPNIGYQYLINQRMEQLKLEDKKEVENPSPTEPIQDPHGSMVKDAKLLTALKDLTRAVSTITE